MSTAQMHGLFRSRPGLLAACSGERTARLRSRGSSGPPSAVGGIRNAKIAKASPEPASAAMSRDSLSHRSGEGAASTTAQAPRGPWRRACRADLGRARALLNKLCPEKFEAILANVLALGIRDAAELSIVIEVLRQVWEQPLYGDSFADLVFVLTEVYSRPGAALDFRRALLLAQRRFEGIWSSAVPPMPPSRTTSKLERRPASWQRFVFLVSTCSCCPSASCIRSCARCLRIQRDVPRAEPPS